MCQMRYKALYRTRDAISLPYQKKHLFMLHSIVTGFTVLLKVIHAFHSLLVLLSQSDPSKLSGEACWNKGESGLGVEKMQKLKFPTGRVEQPASRSPRASVLRDNMQVPKGLQDARISTQDYGQQPSAFAQMSFWDLLLRFCNSPSSFPETLQSQFFRDITLTKAIQVFSAA